MRMDFEYLFRDRREGGKEVQVAIEIFTVSGGTKEKEIGRFLFENQVSDPGQETLFTGIWYVFAFGKFDEGYVVE